MSSKLQIMWIPVEVSGRHIHLSNNDLNKLFGSGYKLKKLRNLSQPGEFACEEKIILKNGDKKLTVRIIGPARQHTQIEIAKSDADKLGLNPPRNLSGDLHNSLQIMLVGPKDEIVLKNGLILAKAHIHCDEKNAKKYNLVDNQLVKVKCKNYIFSDILVRVSSKFELAMHIDVDEAIKAGIEKGEIVKGLTID